MRKTLVAAMSVIALVVPASAAFAGPIVDACNNIDPDVHVTAGDVAEACFDYPN